MPTIALRSLSIPGADGQMLSARLDVPEGDPTGYALFAHCFTCSKDILAASRIASRLAHLGVAVLRFDFTGLGASEGVFAETNFTTNVRDLEAVAGWMEDNGMTPTLAIGHSLGGAAILVAAEKLTMVRAFATLAAPAHASHIVSSIGAPAEEAVRTGAAEAVLGGRPFAITRQFVEDVKSVDVLDSARRLRRPLMILHSPVDQVVGIENASEIFQAARHPKSFVSLDGADHLLSRREDAGYAADIIAAWAGRYAFANEARGEDTPGAEAPGVVTVAETGASLYQNRIVSGRNVILADEPTSLGGSDTGLSPGELVSAALGACTSITLRMYADRKGWPLEKVSVVVARSKAETASLKEEDRARLDPNAASTVDQFERRIRLQGDLDAEQRLRLLEIAEKCPVHRTLQHVSLVMTTEST